MDSDFLLKNPLSKQLYESVAEYPLIDWHNHLSIKDLAENRMFENLTELWLDSDPYKHRAMRIFGVPETFITGNAPAYAKFMKWSEILPKLPGNPLYHWSMLELKRIFGIEEDLNPGSAPAIWAQANEKLRESDISARGLLKKFKVEYLAPCVALTDDGNDFPAEKWIVPSLRGDTLTSLDKASLSALEKRTGIAIRSLDDFRTAAGRGIQRLHERGCRFADHALDGGFAYCPGDGRDERRFRAFLEGRPTENVPLRSAIFRILAGEYARRGWTMQLHIGAQRQTSARLRRVAGPAGGYAGIAHGCDICALTAMLNDFESAPEGLPRVILYTVNPADHAALAVLSGSYSREGVEGLIQLGPAWWFCDHIYGMRDCFEHIAAYGALSTFIGMTTDSRSFLSFVRHEYFRRTFCSWLGEKALRGEMPSDFEKLKQLAAAVCYENAKKRIS